jgi:hypothetical protein
VDPGRWILGVALPHWGCANPDCEAGVLWSTGARCRACHEAVIQRAGAPHRSVADPAHGSSSPSPHSRVARVAQCCPQCERPHRPGNSGLCAPCLAQPSPTPGPPPHMPVAVSATARGNACQGQNCTCGRPTPNGLCWRCRLASEPRRQSGRPVPSSTP